MKVSLVIPAHNEEKLLGYCLNCVVKNKEEDSNSFYEIIVVDNASTDSTAAVAKTFNGVKVVYEAEKGIMFARQKGFVESTGDIIAYVDADTRMPEDWLKKVIKIFEENSDLVCVSGPYAYYDLNRLQNLFIWSMFGIARVFYYVFGHVVIGGNFAMRRETLEKMNGMDTKIAFYGDDSNIGRRAHLFGKVIFDSNLVMPTSGRRLNSQGVVTTFIMYAASYFTEVLLKIPLFKTYHDHR
jgi:glycosyltransferase involved in cell wall biosynthesis